jgi:hypothetical protein
LGPLLFLIYINYFPYGIYHTGKPTKCAEDISVLIAAKNINELQIQLRLNWTTGANGFSKWFNFKNK